MKGIGMYRVTKSAAGIGLGVLTAASLVAQAGVVHSWDAPVSGLWNEGFRWDTGLVPDSFDGALLGGVGVYTVSMSSSDAVGFLDVANPDTTLGLLNAQTLTINGSLLTNNGQIVINSNSGSSATQIFFGGNSVLDGTGSVLLNRPGTMSRIRSAGGAVVTQSGSHMIHGQGQIEAGLLNGGIVRSNIAGQEMRLVTNSKTNNLLMEAVNGARLDVASITISQGVNGVIQSEGVGSKVELSAATIVGGSLTAGVDGITEVASSSVLDSVFKSGGLDLLNAQTLTIRNSFVNEGLINVNSNSGGSATTLFFADSMSLDGPGGVLLNQTGSRSRIQTGAGVVLTIPADQTITGRGQIEGAVVNNGLIQTSHALEDMRLVTNPKTNNATIEAINGARLDITGITISQIAPGVVRADGIDSQVKLSGVTIDGGDLEAVNGAKIMVNGSSTLDGVSLLGDLDLPNAQTLAISNTFVNNGLITVNSTAGGSATNLVFNHSMTLAGTGAVHLSQTSSRARIQTLAGVTLTIPATQTIFGQGQIEGVIINHGQIQCGVLGGEMRLLTNAKTNNATIRAFNGARIDVSGITINQGAGAVIRADGAGSQIELSGATIVNGNLENINGGEVVVLSSSTLDGMNFTGDLDLLNAQTLIVKNSITNNGLITINSNSGGSATTMIFNDSMSLEGIGTVVLNRPSSQARIQTASGVTLTIPAFHTVMGQGQIEGVIVNEGLIQANVNGGEMRMVTNAKINNAMIEAVNDARIDVSGITINQGAGGMIRAASAGAQIELSGSVIAGGGLETILGADIEVLSSSTLDGVTLSGDLNLLNAQTLTLKTGLVNDGLIVVNSNSGGSATSLLWDDAMTVGGTGTIRLNRPSTQSRLLGTGGLQGGLGSGQRLEGIGQIGMDLVNNGTIAPGLSVGTMFANQPVLFGSSSHFEAEVNAVLGDLLDSSSTVELHGTLDVLFIDGFSPTGFWARTIIEGSDITGEFDVVNMPPAPSGLVTKVVSLGTELIIGQTCPTDQNLDGALDFFDIASFLAAFAAMDPAADFTGDGEFDFFDIATFLTLFSTGCP